MYIGEAFVGEIPDNAHPNIVLGRRETMFPIIAQSLAQPTRDHVSYMTVLKPNVLVKPDTLFVNKVPTDNAEIARLTWGPAQAGVALGVYDALVQGILPPGAETGWMIIATVWVNPRASDAAAIERNNREATRLAIENALKGISRDLLDSAAASASNPFHTGTAA